MEQKIFNNPVLKDSANFLETSRDTNGEYSLIEIELQKSDGPPLHYHNAFSENFEVKAGKLFIQVGKKHMILDVGESYLVPPGTPHRFYNKSNDKVTFNVRLRPGHTGMENFIKIFYGLAVDGLTNSKGQPKNFKHLAVAVVMSDSNRPWPMSLLTPLIKSAAAKAKKDGTEQWLLDKYCK